MQGDLRYRYRQKNLKMNEKDESEGKKKGTRVPHLKIDLCSCPLICFVSHTDKQFQVLSSHSNTIIRYLEDI